MPPKLILLINCSFFTDLNGRLNKLKDNASRIVDLPAPFSPTTKVVWFLSKPTSIKLLPVDRKFFHLTFLNTIIVPHHLLQYIMFLKNL